MSARKGRRQCCYEFCCRLLNTVATSIKNISLANSNAGMFQCPYSRL
uniref:Uncharacterized protein n=1 Tax=Anguilla anguilla TaxID=7936 RepID=A0A0E9S3X9_ANGAN